MTLESCGIGILVRVGNDSLVGVSAALGHLGAVAILNFYGSRGPVAMKPDPYSGNLIPLISVLSLEFFLAKGRNV